MPEQTGAAPLCRRCNQHRDSNIHLKHHQHDRYHPYVGGSTVFAVDTGEFVIKLDAGIHCQACQAPAFKVTYGQQVDKDLNYDQAAEKLGQAIMHALATEGLLDGQES